MRRMHLGGELFTNVLNTADNVSGRSKVWDAARTLSYSNFDTIHAQSQVGSGQTLVNPLKVSAPTPLLGVLVSQDFPFRTWPLRT
mmetsp:Transcript_1297/g.1634  ORF Transcript_1297/g.1634 Transcript_1297/m.1634 type:complete len:85 (-) Transcript_1297:312-566(-)